MPGSKKSVRTGRIHIHPTGFKVYPPNQGTKQAATADALRKGATMDDLRKVLVSQKTGKPWTDDAIWSMLHSDLRNKGYGVRTDDDMDRGFVYHLIDPSEDAA